MSVEPFLGEIQFFAGSYPPKGWLPCDGRLLNVSSNAALYSLLGTRFGGNGQTTFALPDLRGRLPIHASNGLSPTHILGEAGGTETATVSIAQLPPHRHAPRANAGTEATANSNTPSGGAVPGQTIGRPSRGADFPVTLYAASLSNPVTLAPQSVASAGSGQPHENRQPFLALTCCIAVTGIFPQRQ